MFSASMRAASASTRRLSQIQRHLTTASSRTLQDAYILSAVRTPTGKFQGGLKDVPATQLGAAAIKEAVSRSKVPVEEIDEVCMGAVLQAGLGQAPARQAMIFGGIPEQTEAITINKVCSSGLKAVVFAAQNIQMGLTKAAVAGGMENMSSVPRYVARTVGSYGDVKEEDGIIKDGLWDVYNQFHMGNCAENTAKNLNISREDQDKYAVESYRRAKAAWDAKSFDEEIVPVTVKQKKGEIIITKDEDYEAVKLDKVPTLKPAFQKDGTVTAANASTLNDGASALVVGNAEVAKEFGANSRVLARIVSYADAAVAPVDFPIAPTKAIPIALERAGLKKEDIALWEINEAFAAVSKAIEKTLDLDPSKVNVKGGAIALGHALGSSGSRILTTLLYQLKVGEYGVAAICNGGGGATALVVQRIAEVE